MSIHIQGCRAALESRIVLVGSVAGGIGIVFGILEVSFFATIQLVISAYVSYNMLYKSVTIDHATLACTLKRVQFSVLWKCQWFIGMTIQKHTLSYRRNWEGSRGATAWPPQYFN